MQRPALFHPLTVLLCCALLLIGFSVVPTTQPASSTPESPITPAPATTTATKKRPLSGWLVPWNTTGGIDSLGRETKYWGAVFGFWYELAPNSSITTKNGANDPRVRQAARKAGIPVFATISNGFRRERAHRMLRSRSSRLAHARALTNLAVAGNYRGIDIDYENIDPADRDRFSAFVRVLSIELHRKQKLLSVTVQAKTADNQGASGARAVNWGYIGRYADQVRIMAYDYHWSGGSAGPIGPRDWVSRTLSYAVSVIPRSKIWLGVHMYGYDWPSGSRATAKTWREAERHRRRIGAQQRWDAAAGEAWYRYTVRGRRHTVYYSTARTVAVRAQLAKQYGIAGITTWRLGDEDRSSWTAARRGLVR